MALLVLLPEPHQQGSLRPIFSSSDLTTVAGLTPPWPVPAGAAAVAAVPLAAAVATAPDCASRIAEGR
ncbi:MAG: hypothetical protein ABWZ18_01050, partial [Solirubrobacterales bacterium]